MDRFLRATIAALVFFAVAACSQNGSPASQADAEKAVRAADEAWAAAVGGKRLEEAVAAVATTGSILPANAAIATGPAAVREFFSGAMAMPGFAGTWRPTAVHAARSGDLGYSTGTYELGFTDPAGKPAKDRGKSGTVWQKQPDGSWKVVLDIFNSDLPLPGSKP